MARALLLDRVTTGGRMGRERPGASAWLPRYREDLGQLVRTRLRWCGAMSLAGVTTTVAHVAFTGPPDARTRFLVAAGYALPSLAALGATYLRASQGREVRIALAYVLVLCFGLARNFWSVPEDGAAAPGSFLTIMMGTTLLLPWGPRPQATVALVALIGFAWLISLGITPPTTSSICLVVSAALVSVAGAMLIDRYRATSFERAWQQEELVSLARELAQHVDRDEIVAKVLAHGVRVMAADSAWLSLRDPTRPVFRVSAVSDKAPAHDRWAVGLEIPEEFPVLRQIVAAGTFFELPSDDPESPLIPAMAESGVHRVLYVTMRYADEVVGILNFVRRADVPFGAGERLLGQGIADQTALALRTARLVTDLRRANDLKSEFVSTMSHELRTPLNVILGFAEMARDPALSAAEHGECVERIEAAGRELLGLIESTLEIGKIEAGRDEARLEPVALAGFWAALSEAVRRIPRKAGVALHWSTATPTVTVTTDPRKLTVVVRNLVGNALKFTESGHVRGEAWLDGTSLVLRVSDTGVGIRAEDHEAIFEMFRQADGSDSRRYGGTGLGLYIVRRFVQQLGGTVRVDSAPGRGSVFTVTLPAAAEREAASDAA